MISLCLVIWYFIFFISADDGDLFDLATYAEATTREEFKENAPFSKLTDGKTCLLDTDNGESCYAVMECAPLRESFEIVYTLEDSYQISALRLFGGTQRAVRAACLSWSVSCSPSLTGNYFNEIVAPSDCEEADWSTQILPSKQPCARIRLSVTGRCGSSTFDRVSAGEFQVYFIPRPGSPTQPPSINIPFESTASNQPVSSNPPIASSTFLPSSSSNSALSSSLSSHSSVSWSLSNTINQVIDNGDGFFDDPMMIGLVGGGAGLLLLILLAALCVCLSASRRKQRQRRVSSQRRSGPSGGGKGARSHRSRSRRHTNAGERRSVAERDAGGPAPKGEYGRFPDLSKNNEYVGMGTMMDVSKAPNEYDVVIANAGNLYDKVVDDFPSTGLVAKKRSSSKSSGQKKGDYASVPQGVQKEVVYGGMEDYE